MALYKLQWIVFNELCSIFIIIFNLKAKFIKIILIRTSLLQSLIYKYLLSNYDFKFTRLLKQFLNLYIYSNIIIVVGNYEFGE
jgi:hypothetical protein